MAENLNKLILNNDENSVRNYEFDISIVIVNYNVRDFLNKCLASIRTSLDNFKVETIVVDNNSTDGSIAFLQDLYPEVKFIELKENLGFSKANNIGFNFAKGKYILILNPDTILSADTLRVMYDFMEASPEVWISGCKILNADGTFQLPCRRGFPTPWVAFSKLFGLQSLFPKSKLFAKYNQTFRSTDETYYIDAIMGAFMFARADKIELIGGFDDDYFMYGEDLDMCYRTAKLGGKVSYVHSTSIIHYKGESTKRSSINDIKHFYEAMQIFVRKHYGNSSFFLALLKTGIFLRSFIAYISKYKKDLPLIIADLLIINLVLMISTSIKFGELLGFPSYAYPTVFFVISIVLFLSLFSVGEYFEGENSIRKLLFGILISFFFLSALTYFFKDYAFSRGVLLMTIGLTFAFGSVLRLVIQAIKKVGTKQNKKRVAIAAGINEISDIEEQIRTNQFGNELELEGLFALGTNLHTAKENYSSKISGNLDYLIRNLKDLRLNEIIIFNANRNSEELKPLFAKTFEENIRIHFIHKFEEYLGSEIIGEISSNQPILVNNRLILPRYKFLKRSVDLCFALVMLTLGLPFVLIKNRKEDKYLKNVLNVLKGNYSWIGIFPTENIRNFNSKPGLLNLVKFSREVNLSKETIQRLNDFYEQNYSISLDFDIFIKSILK